MKRALVILALSVIAPPASTEHVVQPWCMPRDIDFRSLVESRLPFVVEGDVVGAQGRQVPLLVRSFSEPDHEDVVAIAVYVVDGLAAIVESYPRASGLVVAWFDLGVVDIDRGIRPDRSQTCRWERRVVSLGSGEEWW